MKWAVSIVSLAVLLGHFSYATRTVTTSEETGSWANYQFDQPQESRWIRYRASGDVWLGLSYALVSGFAVFCFVRIVELRRGALASSAGGLSLTAILWAGICFLTGCCGSPMLPVYLGLFGPKFMGVTKPLTFGLSLLSIAVGYAWMLRSVPKPVD